MNKPTEYVVYARKWRPQTFDDVVGQDHISMTLKNSIEKERIAHAFLFKGPKGVGKTSMARIFAKAVNCDSGPTPTPCNKCPHCVGITSGTEIDVLEIDGASNTGVDNIRELRENVNYSPTSCRFKIYIIDEVHMLSTGAFNALLKTLEEPPRRVIFIFATTDPEKIPETIVSRCNVFDFKRISKQDIITRLERIIEEEKEITIDSSEKDLILSAIADNSDGSMRDAEVILDQAVSFGMGKVTLENVTALLGLTDSKILHDTFEKIASRDTNGLLSLFDELYKRGKNLEVFLKSLMQYVRDLILIKVAGEREQNLILRPEQDLIKMIELVKKFSYPELIRISNVFFDTEGKLKASTQSRFVLELALIKLTTFDPFIKLDDLIARVGSGSAQTKSSSFPSSQRQEEPSLFSTGREQFQTVPHKTVAQTPQEVKKEKPSESKYFGAKPREDAREPLLNETGETPETSEVTETGEGYNHSPVTQADVQETYPEKTEAEALFDQLIKSTREKHLMVNSQLEKLKVLKFENNILYIGVPKLYTFTKKKLEKKDTKNFLEEELSKIYKQSCKIIFEFIDGNEIADEESEFNTEAEIKKKKLTKQELIKSNPIIKKAIELFPNGRFINNH